MLLAFGLVVAAVIFRALISLIQAIGVVAVDQLFGFVGLLIAVPIIATCTILIDELWVKPQERRDGQAPIEPARPSKASRSGRGDEVCARILSGSPRPWPRPTLKSSPTASSGRPVTWSGQAVFSKGPRG